MLSLVKLGTVITDLSEIYHVENVKLMIVLSALNDTRQYFLIKLLYSNKIVYVVKVRDSLYAVFCSEK